MELPPTYGTCNQTDFFIYAACDHDYFEEFGPALIHSVLQNTQFGVHLHLYNPTPDQISYCRSIDRVSITYEYAPIELFNMSAVPWQSESTDPELADRRKRILTAMTKGRDASIQQRIQRTYFAAARFIRLQQLIQPTAPVLAIDIDAVVRKNLPMLTNTKDFYIHYISGLKARYLAGGLYLTGNTGGYEFLKQYTTVLKSSIESDNLYWGIDQDVLLELVPQYNWGQLPPEYIDWNMKDSSFIWTAKGTRKELNLFKEELKKYHAI